MAKAMNDDFAPKLRNLFNSECQAAENAIQTGLYIGYRCPEFTWDCIRINETHKCFCGHLLNEHEKYDGKYIFNIFFFKNLFMFTYFDLIAIEGKKHMLRCGQCSCKRFSFVPSRPEDVGLETSIIIKVFLNRQFQFRRIYLNT
jgi:hypothetical protein